MEKSDNKGINGWRKAGIVAVTGLAGIVGMAGMSCGLGGCQAEYEQRINAVASTQPSNALLQKEAKEAIEFYKRFDDYTRLSELEKREFIKFFRFKVIGPMSGWAMNSDKEIDEFLEEKSKKRDEDLSREEKEDLKYAKFMKKVYSARAPWINPMMYAWTHGDYFYAKQKAFP